MPKSKNKKDQKKRSKNRTSQIVANRKKIEKIRAESILKYIEEQKLKNNIFNGLPSISQNEPNINLDGPMI